MPSASWPPSARAPMCQLWLSTNLKGMRIHFVKRDLHRLFPVPKTCRECNGSRNQLMTLVEPDYDVVWYAYRKPIISTWHCCSTGCTRQLVSRVFLRSLEVCKPQSWVILYEFKIWQMPNRIVIEFEASPNSEWSDHAKSISFETRILAARCHVAQWIENYSCVWYNTDYTVYR